MDRYLYGFKQLVYECEQLYKQSAPVLHIPEQTAEREKLCSCLVLVIGFFLRTNSLYLSLIECRVSFVFKNLLINTLLLILIHNFLN